MPAWLWQSWMLCHSCSFCLFSSGVHCTKPDKLSSTLQKIFTIQHHRLWCCMVKIFTALPSSHRLYYHIQNFWSSDGRVLSPLQVSRRSRRSTYSAMLNHINCLLGDSPLIPMEISAIHEAGGDQTADVIWVQCSGYCCFCYATSH